ncbi:hypothetical protein [Brevibacterium sp. 50QC2O2]|uniref:hypothetical protein n=1 Tax=Brevibacterium sp. 50QC2O2 TaxID=2968459 RepID=UPI00211BF2FB|nr:hypothetical protein [Brevibacterium sp. 50QC2O2]
MSDRPRPDDQATSSNHNGARSNAYIPNGTVPPQPVVPPTAKFTEGYTAPGFRPVASSPDQTSWKPPKHIIWGTCGFIVGLLASTVVVVLQGVWSSSADNPRETARQGLADAVDQCDLGASDIAAVAGDGQSVSFDGIGKHGAEDFDDLRCLGNFLEMPDSVTEEMAHTRALDGRQEDEWGDYRVTWSYHPDDGMNAVFSVHVNEH